MFRSVLINKSGNPGYGLRPFQLLALSIAGCSGGVLRKIMEKMRLKFDNIEIEVDVTRSDEQVKTVEGIHLMFNIYGNELTEETVSKALDIAIKNCAMAQSVKGAIEVEKTFKLIASKG